MAAFIPALGGCIRISEKPADTRRDLVGTDAAVYDKTFRDLKDSDLDLSRFWVERPAPGDEAPIAIDSNTFIDIARRVSPSVVNIFTTTIEEKRADLKLPLLSLLPLPLPLPSVPFETTGRSLGSGFLINAAGFILTNDHVIQNATDIRVVFREGREAIPAKIVGRDPEMDVALLKIDADRELEPLPLGRSEALEVGEFVIAVGNPYGLSHTLTSGVVSAKDRFIRNEQGRVSYVDFIQVDAAINPGNSGGPLINLRGEVVGITSSQVKYSQNIGFAIPIDLVKKLVPHLIKGKFSHGWMGFGVAPLGEAKRDELGYDGEGGVLVSRVESGGPAQRAGLVPGDILLAVDGAEIRRSRDFVRAARIRAPGERMELRVFREGRERVVVLVLEERR